MLKPLKNSKGITLVELMMSVAASTVIAYVIFMAMRIMLTSFETSNVKMTIETSARDGLYRMIQEIRESAPSRVTISTSSSANDTITFYVPDPASPVTSGYAVNWGHQIRYAKGSGTNSSKIIRTDLTANTTKVMADDVTEVSFTGNAASSPSYVTVVMSVQRDLLNGRSIPVTPLTLTGKAKIRNT